MRVLFNGWSLLLCWMLVATVGQSATMAADTFTYADLVHRLIDLEHLAVLPA